MPSAEESPKLCLPCARRALAKQPPQNCGTCIVLNTDPLARVRANAARPGPLDKFLTARAVECDSNDQRR